MAKAYLSLGSNIEPQQHLRSAIAALRQRFGEVVVSRAYRTPSVGFEGAEFLNAAAIIDCDLNPIDLDAWLHTLEDAHRRDRNAARFSNRTLDVDIVFYDDRVLKGPGHLQIPRPELQHAFVLKPLAEIAPEFVDPLSGQSLCTLWKQHRQYAHPFEPVDL